MGRSRKKHAARKREAEKAMGQPAPEPVPEPVPPVPRPAPEPPANVVALKARAQHMGWDQTDRARSQSLDGQAGRALHVAIDVGLIAWGDLPGLWQTWTDFQDARLTFVRLRLGASLFGAMPTTTILSDRVEAEADEGGSDLRSAEEQEADARDAWAHWCGLLRPLGRDEQAALRDQVADTRTLVRMVEVRQGEPKPGHHGPALPPRVAPALTTAGAAFVAALGRLHVEAKR
jgi:hypothetical protein